MRAVIQRVRESSVAIDGRQVAGIGIGVLVLLGISRDDTEGDAEFMAAKTARLRIFEDESGKMNRSLDDIGGEMLVVSQFTLYGDCRKGRRPSFVEAAPPARAESLYEYFISKLREQGSRVQTGRFGASMEIFSVNDGPVTLIVDSK